MAVARTRRGVTLERLSATIAGHVQGVGFRYWTLRHARRLSLTGCVRNSADGRTVEVVAEGDAERLDVLEVLLRRGPPGAVVERYAATRLPATGEFPEFRMERTAGG